MIDMKDLFILGGDIETTGLLTPDHRIVEIYLGIWLNGKRVWKYEQRIDPQRSIAIDAQRVHGISPSDLIGKPTWDAVAPVVQKAISKCALAVGHNGDEFDWPFIKQELERVGLSLPSIPTFDTMIESRWATSVGKNPRLEELCFACGIPYDKALAHAAEYDVERMMDCFFKGIEWGFYELPEELRRAEAA